MIKAYLRNKLHWQEVEADGHGTVCRIWGVPKILEIDADGIQVVVMYEDLPAGFLHVQKVEWEKDESNEEGKVEAATS